MNIVLIGSNGQLGKSIKYVFSKEKYNLFTLNKNQLDISSLNFDQEKISNLLPDLIINAAAFTAVSRAEIESETCYSINSYGTKNIADICQKLKVPLIHISTDYVFDGSKSSPYEVGDKTNPLNVYGMSKLAGEEEIKKKISNFIIIRTSWIFSEFGLNFVKIITKKITTQKDDISVVNDQIGGPTSCRLLAEKILLFVKEIKINNQKIWGIYHYSNLPYTSWYDLSIEIKNIINKLTNNLFQNRKIIPIKTPSSDLLRPLHSPLSTKKINMTLKIKNEEWLNELERVVKKII